MGICQFQKKTLCETFMVAGMFSAVSVEMPSIVLHAIALQNLLSSHNALAKQSVLDHATTIES